MQGRRIDEGKGTRKKSRNLAKKSESRDSRFRKEIRIHTKVLYHRHFFVCYPRSPIIHFEKRGMRAGKNVGISRRVTDCEGDHGEVQCLHMWILTHAQSIHPSIDWRSFERVRERDLKTGASWHFFARTISAWSFFPPWIYAEKKLASCNSPLGFSEPARLFAEELILMTKYRAWPIAKASAANSTTLESWLEVRAVPNVGCRLSCVVFSPIYLEEETRASHWWRLKPHEY